MYIQDYPSPLLKSIYNKRKQRKCKKRGKVMGKLKENDKNISRRRKNGA
jgi:hypothetical protein